MAKKNSTKRRLDELFEAIKTARAKPKIEGGKPSKEANLLFAAGYAKPVNTAFEKAGLDIEKVEDWIRLTICFCAAVYGKGRGQAPTWSYKEYERLLKDIAEIESANRDDKELECCKKLIRKNQGTYNGVSKDKTLRRVLQDAKQWKTIRERFLNLVNKGRGPFDVLKAEKKLRSPWPYQEYERLLNDIAEIKSANPDDNELEWCKKLILKNHGTYNRVSQASTLRRVLQDAKKSKQIRERSLNLANKGRGPFDALKAEKS